MARLGEVRMRRGSAGQGEADGGGRVAEMSVQMFPALPKEIEEALRVSIQRFGVLVPVVQDQHGRILDGHHRARIAAELGIPYRVDLVNISSEDEAREIAYTLNADRRQIDADQRRAIALKLRRLGHSYRAIGGALGVDPKTIWHDVHRSTVEDSTVDFPDKVVGLDGKLRPAQRPAVVPTRDAREAKRISGALSVLDHAQRDLPREDGQNLVDPDQVRALARTVQREHVPTSSPNRVGPLPPSVSLCVADATNLPLGDESVDLIITSPPYALEKSYPEGDIPADDWPRFMEVWLAEAYRVSKVAGRLALNIPLDTARGGFRPTYAQAVSAAVAVGWVYRTTIVWAEGNISRSTARGSVDSAAAPHVIAPVEMIALFSRGDWHRTAPQASDLTHEEWLSWTTGLWHLSGESSPWEGHPAAFPLDLPLRLIKLLSFPGDTVLDPFVGSGTTAVAAYRLGRRALGIDRSPTYISSAARRVASEEHHG